MRDFLGWPFLFNSGIKIYRTVFLNNNCWTSIIKRVESAGATGLLCFCWDHHRHLLWDHTASFSIYSQSRCLMPFLLIPTKLGTVLVPLLSLLQKKWNFLSPCSLTETRNHRRSMDYTSLLFPSLMGVYYLLGRGEVISGIQAIEAGVQEM